jgi:hypothetical protein
MVPIRSIRHLTSAHIENSMHETEKISAHFALSSRRLIRKWRGCVVLSGHLAISTLSTPARSFYAAPQALVTVYCSLIPTQHTHLAYPAG